MNHKAAYVTQRWNTNRCARNTAKFGHSAVKTDRVIQVRERFAQWKIFIKKKEKRKKDGEGGKKERKKAAELTPFSRAARVSSKVRCCA